MLDEFRSTNITWDKATSRIYSPVTANASDEKGRKLVVQIVNSGQVEDLTGATLHLYWETRDKAHDGLDVFDAVDLKKGEFELSYTTGMLSNKGALNANLVLIDTVGRVVSERFKITVTEGIDNDAIQSENSFSSLTQALIDISNLEQNYAPRLNDLTAQLQQTEQELNAKLAEVEFGKVDKGANESITLPMLDQTIKDYMIGAKPLPTVSEGSVNITAIVDKAVTATKLGKNASRAFVYGDSPLAYGAEKFINTSYVLGAIDTGGNDAVNAYKIRSDYFPGGEAFTIKMVDAFHNIHLFKYDSNKTFVSYAGYSDGALIDGTSPYYRAVISRKDGMTIPDVATAADSILFMVGVGNKITEIDTSIGVLNRKRDAYALGYDDIVDVTWVKGALNTSGDEVSSDYKIRTSFFTPTKPILIEFLTKGVYTISLFKYNSSKAFISYTNFTDFPIALAPSDDWYRIVMTKIAGEIVTDVPSYSINLSLVTGVNKIEPYKFKNGMLLGDSISVTAGDGSRNWNRYFREITRPVSFTNVAVPSATWTDKIGTVYDGNPVSAGVDNNVNNVIGNQVQKIINNAYPAPDYIMIAAGTNDNIQTPITDAEIESQFWNADGSKVALSNCDRTTLAGAMRYSVDTLRALYPDAQIFICTPIQRMRSTTNNIDFYSLISLKSDAIRRISRRLGIQVIDSQESGVYDMTGVDGQAAGDFNDGLHLSEDGAKKMGLYNAVKFINWYNH